MRCCGFDALVCRGFLPRFLIAAMLIASGSFFSLFHGAAMSEEIGFIEQFALSGDREKLLKQLIPGTQDYYYYHCLHFHNTEQFDDAAKLFTAWSERHGKTPQWREMMYRHMLLTYDKSGKQSLDYFIRDLNLRFNHEREIPGRERALPNALDQKLISRAKLTKDGLAQRQDLDLFEDTALQWLVDKKLTVSQRRDLLKRLTRPDFEPVVGMIAKDLAEKKSGGFGSMTIHGQLFQEQLDELLRLRPALLNDTKFVETYLLKLAPNPDIDLNRNLAVRVEHLQRVRQFVDKLGPAHNSLKACVLFHRLQLDLKRGTWNRKLFTQYVQLPRHVHYVNPKFMEQAEQRRYPADLNADFRVAVMVPPINNDEALVRTYLLHFFEKANDYKEFAPYIHHGFLKQTFAEAKIVNGLGDPEKWYSMLTPQQYQSLKDRVDLDFLPDRNERFAPDEKVAVELNVKNVKTLIVKVFEINSQNWYRQELREIDTDINLDGLVPNAETVHEYDDPPLRRIKRRFEFPELIEPGVYVIDFIGGGRSSRVLIRKGRLNYVMQTVAQGQLFTILDQDNKPVEGAKIWLEGREFEAEKSGRILLPFSNQPGKRPIVITRGDLASLEFFDHQAETHQLQAAFYVDRESLIRTVKTRLVVRAGLSVNGQPVSLSSLENVQLTIRTVDLDGVSASQTVSDFKLFEDRESTHEFRVPPRLASITFALTAQATQRSRADRKTDLHATRSFSANQIDRTLAVGDLHLVNADELWFVEARGRTGEPLADRPVNVRLKHRDFKREVNATLKTDQSGRIALGPLADIQRVRVKGLSDIEKDWTLPRHRGTYYQRIHVAAGEPIEIPYTGTANEPMRAELSLLEKIGKVYVADRFDAISLADGMLKITDLPRGDYELLLKDRLETVYLKISEGPTVDRHVLGGSRRLEKRSGQPLQIVTLAEADDKIRIQLNRSDKFTRVHLIASRFEPRFDAFASLATVGDTGPAVYSMSDPRSLYVVGRKIGEEYQYILDRKYAKKYPGNMLDRPRLLLNPWEVRSTQTDLQRAADGDSFRRADDSKRSSRGSAARKRAAAAQTGDFANLDFVADQSVMLLNIRPDENGVVEIDKAEIAGCHVVNVIAVDTLMTVAKRLTLPLSDEPTADLRLVEGLDPEQHFAQQKTVSILNKGDALTLDDVRSSRIETYDNLRDVFRLFETLNPDQHLSEFRFVLDWPGLEQERKRELYSKYACHELNFFLLKKDPEFFEQAVVPYLANKLDKTFIDHWLLGDDLQDHLDPWRYARLNVVERTLLGMRVDAGMVDTRKHLQDLYELTPTTRVDAYRWFEQSVLSGSLETEKSLELGQAVNEKLLRRSGRAGAGRGGEGMISGGAAANMSDADDDFAGQDGASPTAESAPEASAPAKPGGSRKKGKLGRRLRDTAMDFMEADEEESLYEFEVEGKLSEVRKLYEKLDKTKEWAENNYYKRLIAEQIADLVDVNRFWTDYANHDQGEPFLSRHFPEATDNFTEMMFALSVLDLPMESAEQESEIEENRLTLTAVSPMIVFHEEIREAVDAREETTILVSQNFYRQDDRYRYDGPDRLDKFIRDEFLINVAYGCQTVVTNPTSSPQKVDVLLQIPVGAFPINGTKYTRSISVDLQPYSTQSIEYGFYFPDAGDYQHYPVHISKEDRVLAFAERNEFHVVAEPSEIDRESWAHISQNGTDDQVLTFLSDNNPLRLNLEKIAFRMQDKRFFERATAVMRKQHVYLDTLWSYSLKHNVPRAIGEYLSHREELLQQCGLRLDSPLVTIDPVVRTWYEHLEYDPLVNARAHQLGSRRRILNDRFSQQYERLMRVVATQREPDQQTLMAITYYLLLQDRIEESLEFFARVNPEKLHTRLQYDYFAAYLQMFSDDPQQAGAIADKYVDYPVDRWRNAFGAVSAQVAEIKGGQPQLVDDKDRNQQQDQLAGASAAFDFEVENKQVSVNYRNLESLTVNYYEMDVELLFSTNPFVQQQSGRLAFVKPKLVKQVKLPKAGGSHEWALPKELHKSNVLVEITGGGLTKSQAYFAHALNLQLVESYGQLQVLDQDSGIRLPKVYVKVYARSQDGRVQFYKDGYTDHRGKFDYASLSTNELDNVSGFSLLVMSDENGALVREVLPPKQ